MGQDIGKGQEGTGFQEETLPPPDGSKLPSVLPPESVWPRGRDVGSCRVLPHIGLPRTLTAMVPSPSAPRATPDKVCRLSPTQSTP